MTKLSDNFSLAYAFNEETLHVRIPALTFLSIAILLGVFGNACVIICGFRMKRTNVFFLITLFSMSDFLGCIVVLPLEVYRVRFFYAYHIASLCKLESFVFFFRFINSTILLLIIAVDRYKRVCRSKSPKMAFSTARKAGITSVVTSLLFAIPAWMWTVPKFSLVDGHAPFYRCAPYLDARLFKYGRGVFLTSFIAWAVILVLYLFMLGTLNELVNYQTESIIRLPIPVEDAEKLSRTNRTVLLLTSVFVCTSSFYLSFYLVINSSKDTKPTDSIHYFLFLLNDTWVINFMSNSFVVGFMNTDFRMELFKILGIK